MTKLFLAAGVAALAISAPTAAQRGDRADRPSAQKARDGGQRADRSAMRAQRVDRSEQRAQRVERRVERPARVERQQFRAERVERRAERPVRTERVRERMAERRDVRVNRIERNQPRIERQERRANRIERAQPRQIERQQARIDRREQVQGRIAARPNLRDQRIDRVDQVRDRIAARQDLRDQRIDRRIDRRLDRTTFEPRFANSNGLAYLPPGQAKKLIGVPLATAASYAGYSTFNAFPSSVSYLYPDTDDYYYRYGDGYAYRVDRDSNLISLLLPLLAGGYMPGSYLPANYMNSYVPNYYGFNNFYQDSPYDCHRYVNGIVYEVDCVTGMIEDVVPLYAGGYGVGQMLPSAYYNVPYDYRGLYADTSDYGYYYAPGAIYQYDQGSSLITSVAALLTPGFGIGQQLPMGYGAYNVPYGYRDNYYDTSNDWYRYNNGNIYRIDPTTQIVTAIVASILT